MSHKTIHETNTVLTFRDTYAQKFSCSERTLEPFP